MEAFSLSQIVAVQTDRFIDVPANGEQIIEASIEEAMRCEREGLLPAFDTDGMRRDAWKKKIGKLVKSGQAQVQNCLGEQSGLDLGAEYDMPLLVCGHKALNEIGLSDGLAGRYTTLGNLRADDIDLMNLEQDINIRGAIARREKSRPNMEANRDLLRGFRNYRAYRAATDQ